MRLEKTEPMEIERRSFEIITRELGAKTFLPEQALVVKRVIHATADFDFADSLCFSDGAVDAALGALRSGCGIVSDSQMIKAGVNKTALAALGGEAHCFVSDEDVARSAKEKGVTRSYVAMQKAATLPKPCIVAVGNAPTALVSLYELIASGSFRPLFIVGAPVGFVNVVQAKELIMTAGVPYIVAKGRKGGSTVAVAIINALLYQIRR